MIALVLIGCAIEGGPLRPAKTFPFALDAVDAGNGQTLSEFAEAELAISLQVDWSTVNFPGFAAETIQVDPESVAKEAQCQVDEAGTPSSCDFEVVATIGSSSGLWSFREAFSVRWSPRQLYADFEGDSALTAEQVGFVADGVADHGLAFSYDRLEMRIMWATDSAPQRTQLFVRGHDDVTDHQALFAQDNTVTGD